MEQKQQSIMVKILPLTFHQYSFEISMHDTNRIIYKTKESTKLINESNIVGILGLT